MRPCITVEFGKTAHESIPDCGVSSDPTLRLTQYGHNINLNHHGRIR